MEAVYRWLMAAKAERLRSMAVYRRSVRESRWLIPMSLLRSVAYQAARALCRLNQMVAFRSQLLTANRRWWHRCHCRHHCHFDLSLRLTLLNAATCDGHAYDHGDGLDHDLDYDYKRGNDHNLVR